MTSKRTIVRALQSLSRLLGAVVIGALTMSGLALAIVEPAGAAEPDPTVTGSFTNDTFVVGEEGGLKLIIANETRELIDFLNVENIFPSSLEMDSAASNTSCPGSLQILDSQRLIANGIALRPNESCEIVIRFRAVSTATFTNNGDAIEIFTDKTPADTEDRTIHPDPADDPLLSLVVIEPESPEFSVSIEPETAVVSQTVTATITITNPNPAPIPDVYVTFFSSDLDLDSASDVTTTCNGETSFINSTDRARLDNAVLAPNAECTVAAAFTAATARPEALLTTRAYQDPTPTTSGDDRTYFDAPVFTPFSIDPIESPEFSVSIEPETAVVSQTVTATITITNPNPAPIPDVYVTFFSSDLDLDSASDVTTTCNGETSFINSTDRARLDNAVLAPNAECTVAAAFTAATARPEALLTTRAYQDPTPTTSGDDRTYFDAPVFTPFSVDPAPEPLTLLDTPCPVYDSRSASGSIAGTLDGGDSRRLTVAGLLPATQGVGTVECVPSGASAVIFTVSAIDSLAGGNLRLSPADVEPSGGVVNYAANGLNNANTVTVPLSDDGRVDLSANGGAAGQFLPSTDVRLIVLGYYAIDGDLDFNTIVPCAVTDTRVNKGGDGDFQGPFSGGSLPDVDVIGEFPVGQGGGNTDCNVPSNASAVLVNVVAINPVGGTGYLSVGPGGNNPAEPLTSFADLGMNNATTTIAAVDANGTISVAVTATGGTPTTHVRIVILGYYDANGLDFWSLTPCTSFDTRSNKGSTGAFSGERLGDSTTTYDVAGPFDPAQGGENADCGVPDDAEAVLINLVAINSLRDGNLRISAGGTIATGGVLNFDQLTPAMNNANAVVVPLNANGEIDVFTNGGPAGAGIPITHIRGIILGYYD